jgi:acyl-coenzyme A thioesterase PaaI-like protein
LSGLRSVKNSRLCFGCGKENEAGLRLDFEMCADGRLETRFTPRSIHGGWEGVFHGGLMATLLDEAMLAYLYQKGIDAATAALEIRYREPVGIGEEVLVHAWEEGRRGRLVSMRAEASRDGKLVAKASARCLRIVEKESPR